MRGSDTVDIFEGDDVAAASGSARGEFERPRHEHADRLRPYRPWLLAGCAVGAVAVVAAFLVKDATVGAVAFFAVVVGVTAVEFFPASRRNWATGANGEALTARALEQLRVEGFIILHDRVIPGTSANIDHIVIGPPGMAVVETESYSGRLRVRGNEIYAHGYRGTWKTVGQAKREAGAVAVALADELRRRRLSVRPILCVHRANLPFFGRSPQGVSIVDGRGLVKVLRAARPVLSPDDVRALASLTNDRLRPASGPMPNLYARSLGPPNGDSAVGRAARAADPVPDERYAPPTRRDHLRLARKARARATDRRIYWTNHGLTEGKAPPTIPPDKLG